MKTMKRAAVVLLAMAMVLMMAVPAFAVPGGAGTITVDKAVEGQTYKVYRLLDLESYNQEQGAYLYTVNDTWEGFFADGAPGAEYVEVNAQGEVSWKADKRSAADMEAVAKSALEWAQTHNISADGTKTAEGTTVVFDGLGWGYYLVDSSLGALCALNTSASSVTIEEKNGVPTVDKQVEENGVWGDVSSAQIGDTVKFQTTITAMKGAQNYVLHDKMDAGLTFDSASVSVTKNGAAVAADSYDVKAPAGDGCTFHVEFTQAFCDTLADGDAIVVSYFATLNKDAQVGGVVGNKNETWLKYGDGTDTTHDSTTTYTYRLQIVKTDEGDGSTFRVLDGAEFSLFAQESNGAALPLIKVSDGLYRVAEAGEQGTTTVIGAGAPLIEGLDAKTYYLQEDKAPAGYNKVSGRAPVNLESDNVVVDGGLSGADPVVYAKDHGGVQVQNSKGDNLPTTGGMGTTVLYVAGGILIAAAVAGLVVLRRKSSRQ